MQGESAHYAVTTESVDSGGGAGTFQSISAPVYTHDSALGLMVEGHSRVGAAATIQGGYLSQLNNPPVPGVFVLSHRKGQGAKALLTSLLSTAVDPDGDLFSVMVDKTTVQGGVAGQTTRFLAYQPPTGSSGVDVIHYRLIDDAGDSSMGSVDVVILPQSDSVTSNQLLLEFPPSGGAHLVFVGALNQTYQVQVAESLVPPVQWTGLVTTPSAVQPGFFEAVDALGGHGSQRFYRTISL